MSSSVADIVILGAGVIGLTTALKLAEQGTSVTVFDRQPAGREASWAGAGMLPPGNLKNAEGPEARLRAFSHSLWPALAEQLLSKTGIDNGYRNCGAVELATDDSGSEHHLTRDSWAREGIQIQGLTRSQLESHVPGIHDRFTGGVYLPEFCQVRNPRHLQALRAACLQAGVRIVENCPAIQLVRKNQRIAARTGDGSWLSFDRLCVTAGAWSTALLDAVGIRIPVKPVRGQIVQLRADPLPFRCVIELGRRYLVPRPDGLILIGSTEEYAGFCKQNTAEGVSGLLQFSISLVPALRNAEVAATWAGLRPQSPDELPLLGKVPGFDNLFVGAGHFRSGLQMSPGTAAILAALLQECSSPISLEGLNCERYVSAAESGNTLK